MLTGVECVPFEDAAIEAYPSVDAWQSTASVTVATMLHRWQLTAGAAFVGGISGATLRVTRADGTPAVLKVAYPHVEGKWEAVGLQALPEDLHPAVLQQDAWTWSMLLEEVTPGRPLAANGAAKDLREALIIGGRLHHGLTRAAVPNRLPRLADAMRDYSAVATDRLEAQKFELDGLGVGDVVAAAIQELSALSGSGPDGALLHGDFNPGNILDAGDGRWVTIDPKPLVGDPSYDLWPLVSQLGAPFRSSKPAAQLTEQMAIAADAAGCDQQRASRWAWARTALNVTWYLAEGNPDQARAEANALIAWSGVVGY
ncbi:MAG: aminoglycoside phosphotransferase [Glaciihabitans sp.]|nr:aminoglycoside phosphotransferase [Glaciihabitans sp.]